MYFNRAASSSWVSISDNEPFAMFRKCMYSFTEFLDDPSEMFDGMDMAALLICDTRP